MRKGREIGKMWATASTYEYKGTNGDARQQTFLNLSETLVQAAFPDAERVEVTADRATNRYVLRPARGANGYKLKKVKAGLCYIVKVAARDNLITVDRLSLCPVSHTAGRVFVEMPETATYPKG